MLKGYKTVVGNAILIGIAILESTGFTNFFPNADPQVFVSVVAVLNIVLRFFTSTPVGKK